MPYRTIQANNITTVNLKLSKGWVSYSYCISLNNKHTVVYIVPFEINNLSLQTHPHVTL